MSRPQNWSIMIHDMAKMVHKGTVDLSTKIIISQTACSLHHMPAFKGWCPRGRLDDPSDDSLTVAILTDANVPSLLNTDVKV